MAYAQTSTFSKVYQIFQANCTASCHSGATPSANLDLAASETDVYNRLIEQNPANADAVADGMKLVDPGYPERSFLMVKCSYPEWDAYYEKPAGYGSNMPPYGSPPLAQEELELIRQWIYQGAPETGVVEGEQLAMAYYTSSVGKTKLEIPPAPDPSEGFQVRLGSFFLPPNAETEIYKKHQLNMPDDFEVNRIEIFFNEESHHFILYKFPNAGAAANYPDGFRDVNSSNILANDFVSIWQDVVDINLPEGTAYRWNKNVALDLNYHIKNYSPDSILACDVYMNIYTQPKGTAVQEMLSNIVPINLLETMIGTGFIGQDLVIPSTGQEITITESINIPFPYDPWYVWLLSSHTHQLGTDYDIYLRNPDGSRGDQIFEGFYDFTYTFNQGFYDWAHPPVRYFDPFLPLDLNEGVIHEAKFLNNTGQTVRWGNTTEDEMMLFFIQYTEEPYQSTAIDDALADETNFYVYPNPFEGSTSIRFQLDRNAQVDVSVFDLMGKKIQSFAHGHQLTGEYTYEFNPALSGFSSGMYLVKLTVDGRSTTHKIIAK